MLDTEELKTQVHDFWQVNPCGAKFAREKIGTREFFEANERHRYQTTDPSRGTTVANCL